MKRMIASVLAFILLFATVPQIAYASASTKTSNYTMNGFTYTVDAKTQTATITEYTGNDTTVKIPDELGGYPVATIGAKAFEHCNTITNIEFPEGLTTIQELAFAHCSSLETVTLPDSVEFIGREAFAYCTGLRSINFPLNWTTAGALQEGYIFRNCTNLTNIVVPEGVETIPAHAFQGFSSLQKITLPSTLKEIKMCAFESCTGLTHIDIPDSVTYIGDRAFSGCDGLRQITLPASLKTIQTAAFQYCENLETVSIPGPIENIRKTAFGNCPKLQIVSIANKDCEPEKGAFLHSDKVTIVCPLNSLATTYAIDYDLAFSAGNSPTDTANEVLDRNASFYQAAVYNTGYVTLKLDYAISQDKWPELKNPKITLKIPKGTKIDESTIYLDGELCHVINYNSDETSLVLNINNPSGTIRFSAQATEQVDIRSYAILQYGRTREVIGVVDESVHFFSFTTEEFTSSKEIQLTGMGPAQTEVEIYVDNELAETVTTNKAGDYLADVELKTSDSFHRFNIEARSVDRNGEPLSFSMQVAYSEKAPALKGFLFYPDNTDDHFYNLYSLSQQGIRPIITFKGSPNPMKFVVKMDMASEIETLYVTSTRNNVKKSLPAVYDKATDTFIVEGYFDEDNKGYVPGRFGVEYNLKRHEDILLKDGEIDWNALSDCMSDELKEKVKVETVPTPNGVSANFDFSDMPSEDVEDLFLSAGQVILNATLESFGGEVGDTVGTLYSYALSDKENVNYILSLDYSDPGALTVTLSNTIADGYQLYNEYQQLKLSAQLQDYMIAGKEYPADTALLADKVSKYSTALDLIASAHRINTNYNQLCNEIRTSDVYLHDHNKMEQALEKAEELRTDQLVLVLASTVLPALATGGMSSAAGTIFTLLVSAMVASSDFFYEQRIADIKAGTFDVKWAIDPSGYVYDAITEDRLKGVTATVYCIEYDESETFWDNVPTQDQYGTMWNALEYSQQNPLITDGEGRYAWDVPEGWWRVKYEKEGYETTWSEWLPVPPPQTEVNIGMTPLEIPGTPEPSAEPTASPEPDNATDTPADTATPDNTGSATRTKANNRGIKIKNT